MRCNMIQRCWGVILVFAGILISPMFACAEDRNAHAPAEWNQEILLQRLQVIEQELQELREWQNSTETVQPAGAQRIWLPEPAPGVACLEPLCSPAGPAGQALTPATYPSVRLTGFMQADTAFFNQSQTSIDTVGNAEDGMDFRRARLAAIGQAAENVGYLVEFDFAFPGRPSFMDVWLEVRELPVLGNLRVGQWRQPFGMDELTSARELMFLELGLPFAFAPMRQIGIGFHNHQESSGSTWAASLFRFPTDPFGGNVGDSGGYSFASRATTLLWDDQDNHSLIHLGVDYSLITPSNNLARFRNTPEIFLSEQPGALAVAHSMPFFVDTHPIPTNLYHLINVESAFRHGSWSGQAEWRMASVDQTGGPDLNFQSAYGQIAYILTGETRPYNRTTGVFTRVIPNRPFKAGCNPGAWETAARLSWIDQDDKNVTGHQMVDMTLGVNWYLNKHTKFQFNYIYSHLYGETIPSSNTNIVAARAQVDF